MFSKNGQISIRQTYRLLLFDLIGLGTLLLPPVLAGLSGSAAVWSIVIGTAATYLYLLMLTRVIKKMKTDLLSYLRSYRIIIALLGINAIAMAAMCGYVFTELVRRELVPEERYELVLALILIVSAYAVIGGIESRARVYEVLFWFVIVPLLIMLLVAAKDIKPVYFEDVLSIKPFGIIKGSYLVFMSFSTLFYLLMFPAFVAPRNIKKLGKAGAIALAGAAAILLLTYLVLVGSFGGRALSNMSFPAVTLMSTVKIEGSFFKRTDAFMLGIWFFTLYALLNINLFYGAKKLEKLVGKGRKRPYVVFVTAAVYALACYFKYGDAVMEKYIRFLFTIGVPVLVIIPLAILFMGCNSTELEDRCFPMLAAVGMEADNVTFSYVFPKMETGKSKESEKLYENNGAREADFESARKICEENLVKKPDANHLKILMLEQDFYKDKGAYGDMLKYLQQEENFPRNAYVCITKQKDEVLEVGNDISEDVGTYVEQLLEKRQDEQGLVLVTIGDLIDENDNGLIAYDIPFLYVEDNEIKISE